MTTSNQSAQTGDRPKRLLIVIDGSASNRYYTGILLQRLEYNIFTAKLAEEALEIMDITVPALIVTEAELPKMNGLEFLKVMLENPRIKQVPVIVYTVSQNDTLKQAYLDQGVVSFLNKPADPTLLYSAIQKATESVPRQFIRLAVCLEVIVGDEMSGGAVKTGEYITALSENGMYVYTPNPRKVGMQVPFTIFFQQAAIKLTGTVLYSFNRGQGPLRTPGMGIKFSHIRPEDQDLIRDFIHHQVTKDIA